ncbi:MAG: hypothetical protein U1E87_04195 [Alphaproteobacteria bacterium]
MAPHPWRSDHQTALAAWTAAKPGARPGLILWLSDGAGDIDTKDFAKGLAATAELRVLRPEDAALPLAIKPARTAASGLETKSCAPAPVPSPTALSRRSARRQAPGRGVRVPERTARHDRGLSDSQ